MIMSASRSNAAEEIGVDASAHEAAHAGATARGTTEAASTRTAASVFGLPRQSVGRAANEAAGDLIEAGGGAREGTAEREQFRARRVDACGSTDERGGHGDCQVALAKHGKLLWCVGSGSRENRSIASGVRILNTQGNWHPTSRCRATREEMRKVLHEVFGAHGSCLPPPPSPIHRAARRFHCNEARARDSSRTPRACEAAAQRSPSSWQRAGRSREPVRPRVLRVH